MAKYLLSSVFKAIFDKPKYLKYLNFLTPYWNGKYKKQTVYKLWLERKKPMVKKNEKRNV